jgi:hypothetical protein
MMKLNSLARARVIDPEGGAEDGADSAGVGEGAAGVDVLVVSSSGGALVIFPLPLFFNFQLVYAYVCVVFSVLFKFSACVLVFIFIMNKVTT